mgnify:CR=1 FL=1
MTIAAGTAEPAPARFELRALEARVLVFHNWAAVNLKRSDSFDSSITP